MSVVTSAKTVADDEVALLVRPLAAAGDEPRALGDALVDVAGDPVALGAGDQRPEPGVGIVRVAGHVRRGRLGGELDRLVVLRRR